MKRLLLIAVPVLVAVGVGGWWFFLRDDAPSEASLPDRPSEVSTTAPAASSTSAASSTTGSSSATSSTAASAASADGTWTVQPGESTFVGYRVEEQFAGDTIKKTAVGRTVGVTGTVTVAGQQVTAASFEADLTKLKSDSSRRDGALQGRGLVVSQFPVASFTLTSPIDLGGAPTVGSQVTVKATGDLTLKGTTKSVTLDLQARWNGDTIDLAGSTGITMGDFAIEPPTLPGIVTVDDNGTLELQLVLVRS